MNKVPERLINFKVYNEGNEVLGVADVEMPELEAMTDTVSGAGIAGEIDSPLLGHYGSMTSTITFRTVTPQSVELAAPKSHKLEFRGSQQVYNAATGEYTTCPVRVSMVAACKNFALGGLEVGAATDTENEFEVYAINVWVDGKQLLEIDKMNFVVKINGVDYTASIRKDLGMN